MSFELKAHTSNAVWRLRLALHKALSPLLSTVTEILLPSSPTALTQIERKKNYFRYYKCPFEWIKTLKYLICKFWRTYFSFANNTSNTDKLLSMWIQHSKSICACSSYATIHSLYIFLLLPSYTGIKRRREYWFKDCIINFYLLELLMLSFFSAFHHKKLQQGTWRTDKSLKRSTIPPL